MCLIDNANTLYYTEILVFVITNTLNKNIVLTVIFNKNNELLSYVEFLKHSLKNFRNNCEA